MLTKSLSIQNKQNNLLKDSWNIKLEFNIIMYINYSVVFASTGELTVDRVVLNLNIACVDSYYGNSKSGHGQTTYCRRVC